MWWFVNHRTIECHLLLLSTNCNLQKLAYRRYLTLIIQSGIFCRFCTPHMFVLTKMKACISVYNNMQSEFLENYIHSLFLGWKYWIKKRYCSVLNAHTLFYRAVRPGSNTTFFLIASITSFHSTLSGFQKYASVYFLIYFKLIVWNFFGSWVGWYS